MRGIYALEFVKVLIKIKMYKISTIHRYSKIILKNRLHEIDYFDIGVIKDVI